MEIKDLTNRMAAFVAQQGWDKPGSSKPQTARNLAISLVLESSEVLECFQWSEQLPEQDRLALELADVALYTLQLASVAGIDLEQAVLKKLELNTTRRW